MNAITVEKSKDKKAQTVVKERKMDPVRLKIYNSGVLQGKQGAHQSFLFLNKQGLEKKDDSVGR